MELCIKDNLINYQQEGEIFIVNDDFFSNYPLKINCYDVKITNGNIELIENEKAVDCRKEIENQNKNQKLSIVAKLGELKIQRDGLELLGENLNEINLQIEDLKTKYNLI